jgi:electron transport complex protein RnfB
MDADYYLETIRVVFQEFALVNGTWDVISEEGELERVRPEDIKTTAHFTIEGELDDISGSGQTEAAHDLCYNVPKARQKHVEVKGAGHYGIFSGRRWRDSVYPQVRDFIPHPTGRVCRSTPANARRPSRRHRPGSRAATGHLPEVNELAARLHAALPQTQCTRCGYPDCAAYAQAIASGEAEINQCPPGGAEGIARLAAITGRPVLPLNPANGAEGPRTVAVIDEAWCIGCTLCMEVCPTDAILGSNKLMHTVVEPYCTGCELCVPVCPVDCISLEGVTGERTGWQAWSQAEAAQALERYQFRQERLARAENEHSARLEAKALANLADLPAHTHVAHGAEADRKRAVIRPPARARPEKYRIFPGPPQNLRRVAGGAP